MRPNTEKVLSAKLECDHKGGRTEAAVDIQFTNRGRNLQMEVSSKRGDRETLGIPVSYVEDCYTYEDLRELCLHLADNRLGLSPKSVEELEVYEKGQRMIGLNSLSRMF